MEYIDIWIKHLSLELYIVHPQCFIDYISYFPDEIIDKIKEKTYIGITDKIERIISELDITNKELLDKINNKLRIYENDQSELFKEINKEINKGGIYPNSYETLSEFSNKLSSLSLYVCYLDENPNMHKNKMIIILFLFASRINYEWVEIDTNKKFLFEYIDNYEDELFIVIRDKSIFGISLNLLSFIKGLNIENKVFINFMLFLRFIER